MAKAQVGDLVRITADWATNDKGRILEVDSVHENDAVNTVNGDSYLWLESDEYEIFRKAGEEDDVDPIYESYMRTYGDVGPIIDVAEQLAGEYDAQITQANRIRAACSELADLLVRKNHDYGDSFSKQYEKYGLMSALIRMDDKMRRLESLQAKGNVQVDESVADTLLDLAGYALLTYVENLKGVDA